MSGVLARRGFLRGLASLPLIGGGVTLIGNPTAAAVPVTEALLSEYANWLNIERYRAHAELGWPPDQAITSLHGPAFDWHDKHSRSGPFQVPPSTRAAVVLSTVGCDWRRA